MFILQTSFKSHVHFSSFNLDVKKLSREHSCNCSGKHVSEVSFCMEATPAVCVFESWPEQKTVSGERRWDSIFINIAINSTSTGLVDDREYLNP